MLLLKKEEWTGLQKHRANLPTLIKTDPLAVFAFVTMTRKRSRKALQALSVNQARPLGANGDHTTKNDTKTTTSGLPPSPSQQSCSGSSTASMAESFASIPVFDDSEAAFLSNNITERVKKRPAKRTKLTGIKEQNRHQRPELPFSSRTKTPKISNVTLHIYNEEDMTGNGSRQNAVVPAAKERRPAGNLQKRATGKQMRTKGQSLKASSEGTHAADAPSTKIKSIMSQPGSKSLQQSTATTKDERSTGNPQKRAASKEMQTQGRGTAISSEGPRATDAASTKTKSNLSHQNSQFLRRSAAVSLSVAPASEPSDSVVEDSCTTRTLATSQDKTECKEDKGRKASAEDRCPREAQSENHRPTKTRAARPCLGKDKQKMVPFDSRHSAASNKDGAPPETRMPPNKAETANHTGVAAPQPKRQPSAPSTFKGSMKVSKSGCVSHDALVPTEDDGTPFAFDEPLEDTAKGEDEMTPNESKPAPPKHPKTPRLRRSTRIRTKQDERSPLSSEEKTSKTVSHGKHHTPNTTDASKTDAPSQQPLAKIEKHSQSQAKPGSSEHMSQIKEIVLKTPSKFRSAGRPEDVQPLIGADFVEEYRKCVPDNKAVLKKMLGSLGSIKSVDDATPFGDIPSPKRNQVGLVVQVPSKESDAHDDDMSEVTFHAFRKKRQTKKPVDGEIQGSKSSERHKDTTSGDVKQRPSPETRPAQIPVETKGTQTSNSKQEKKAACLSPFQSRTCPEKGETTRGSSQRQDQSLHAKPQSKKTLERLKKNLAPPVQDRVSSESLANKNSAGDNPKQEKPRTLTENNTPRTPVDGRKENQDHSVVSVRYSEADKSEQQQFVSSSDHQDKTDHKEIKTYSPTCATHPPSQNEPKFNTRQDDTPRSNRIEQSGHDRKRKPGEKSSRPPGRDSKPIPQTSHLKPETDTQKSKSSTNTSPINCTKCTMNMCIDSNSPSLHHDEKSPSQKEIEIRQPTGSTPPSPKNGVNSLPSFSPSSLIEPGSLPLWTAELSGHTNLTPILRFGDGRQFRHTPLPPGWTISISETRKVPYYRHPDLGSTFYPPVLMPSEDGSIRSKVIFVHTGTTAEHQHGEKEFSRVNGSTWPVGYEHLVQNLCDSPYLATTTPKTMIPSYSPSQVLATSSQKQNAKLESSEETEARRKETHDETTSPASSNEIEVFRCARSSGTDDSQCPLEEAPIERESKEISSPPKASPAQKCDEPVIWKDSDSPLPCDFTENEDLLQPESNDDAIDRVRLDSIQLADDIPVNASNDDRGSNVEVNVKEHPSKTTCSDNEDIDRSAWQTTTVETLPQIPLSPKASLSSGTGDQLDLPESDSPLQCHFQENEDGQVADDLMVDLDLTGSNEQESNIEANLQKLPLKTNSSKNEDINDSANTSKVAQFHQRNETNQPKPVLAVHIPQLSPSTANISTRTDSVTPVLNKRESPSPGQSRVHPEAEDLAKDPPGSHLQDVSPCANHEHSCESDPAPELLSSGSSSPMAQRLDLSTQPESISRKSGASEHDPSADLPCHVHSLEFIDESSKAEKASAISSLESFRSVVSLRARHPAKPLCSLQDLSVLALTTSTKRARKAKKKKKRSQHDHPIPFSILAR